MFSLCRSKHNIQDEKIDNIFDIEKTSITIDYDKKEIEINYEYELIKKIKLIFCDYLKKFIKFINNEILIKKEIQNIFKSYFEAFNGKVFNYDYFNFKINEKSFTINEKIKLKFNQNKKNLKLFLIDRNTNIDYNNLKIKKHKKKLTFLYNNEVIQKFNLIVKCNIIKKILKDYIHITYNDIYEIFNMNFIDYNDKELKYTIKVDNKNKSINVITQTYNNILFF